MKIPIGALLVFRYYCDDSLINEAMVYEWIERISEDEFVFGTVEHYENEARCVKCGKWEGEGEPCKHMQLVTKFIAENS